MQVWFQQFPTGSCWPNKDLSRDDILRTCTKIYRNNSKFFAFSYSTHKVTNGSRGTRVANKVNSVANFDFWFQNYMDFASDSIWFLEPSTWFGIVAGPSVATTNRAGWRSTIAIMAIKFNFVGLWRKFWSGGTRPFLVAQIWSGRTKFGGQNWSGLIKKLIASRSV